MSHAQLNSFAQLDLNPNIHKAIKACGYNEPTPIQARSIPDILAGRDVVACAQTGTGKTAAFVLPTLHKLSLQKNKKTSILILTPTRELASQITKSAGIYGKFMRFNMASIVGGMPYHHQIKDLARGADVIVATPGRLLDHIQSKRIDLSGIETLILDEADRMLDMGFIDDVEEIARLTPANRQTLLFSATIDKQIQTVIRRLLKNPIQINLSQEKAAAPKIKQELYQAKNQQHKTRLLKHFLNDANIFKAIIFSATKINADKLAIQLRDQGFSAAALHGDLRQNVRNRTIEQLRRGKIQFLVATDVAARGIDISDVTHVINYDLPRFCEDYIHRIGRTGRAGKTGTAISFVLPSDAKHLQRIERFIGQRIKLLHVQESGTVIESVIAADDFAPRTHRNKQKEHGHKSVKKKWLPKAEFKKKHQAKNESTGTKYKKSRSSQDRTKAVGEYAAGGNYRKSERKSKRFSNDLESF